MITPPFVVLMKPIIVRDILIIIFIFLLPLVSIILGIAALCQIDKSQHSLKGLALAIPALFLSSLMLIVLIIFTPFFIRQYSATQLIAIDDVTHTTTLRLSPSNSKNYVGGLVMLIAGEIDGTANIHMKDHREWDINREKVYLKISTDWYRDECVLEYKPIDVDSGSLIIRYRFSPERGY
jgi:hypothetical protein